MKSKIYVISDLDFSNQTSKYVLDLIYGDDVNIFTQEKDYMNFNSEEFDKILVFTEEVILNFMNTFSLSQGESNGIDMNILPFWEYIKDNTNYNLKTRYINRELFLYTVPTYGQLTWAFRY